jgi:hypothetical protein
MHSQSRNRTGRLRAALVALNVAILATPAVANAHVPHGVLAGGCLAMMIRTSFEASSATEKKTARPPVHPRLHADPRGRCLINAIAEDCHAMAVDIEKGGDGTAAKRRALIYYNKACALRPGGADCHAAKRVAASIGCADPRACEDPTGEPLFDVAAAKTAYGDAVDRLVTSCDNDAPVDAVEIAVVFDPSGTVTSVATSPPLDDYLISICLDDAFLDADVPAFSGNPQRVRMTVSLEDVPRLRER